MLGRPRVSFVEQTLCLLARSVVRVEDRRLDQLRQRDVPTRVCVRSLPARTGCAASPSPEAADHAAAVPDSVSRPSHRSFKG